MSKVEEKKGFWAVAGNVISVAYEIYDPTDFFLQEIAASLAHIDKELREIEQEMNGFFNMLFSVVQNESCQERYVFAEMKLR